MTEKEYTEKILEIVEDGRGYKAIKDITYLLETKRIIAEKELMEHRAESRAIKKYCNSDSMTNKSIVKAIKILIDEESE